MIVRAVRSGKWHTAWKVEKFMVFGISGSLVVDSVVIVRASRGEGQEVYGLRNKRYLVAESVVIVRAK